MKRGGNLMEIENKKKDPNAYLIGFIMGIISILIFPAILLGGTVSAVYILAASLIAAAVIPLVSVLLAMVVKISFVNKSWVGMNLGSVFSIVVLYVLASIRSIELNEHDANILVYGLITSLVAAVFVYSLDIRRQRQMVQMNTEKIPQAE